ncbi:MAG: hypothetical protein EZS28_000629 [Streblomastix strix]|uniref:Uncharacterized protein n=1 Tax=Streblomastix strix TaxID=222440 RepID=A0A5J4XAK6_9EUKA|nr:MAG: hypothetical protein EZS28_000629 [Streblomastix strix]
MQEEIKQKKLSENSEAISFDPVDLIVQSKKKEKRTKSKRMHINKLKRKRLNTHDAYEEESTPDDDSRKSSNNDEQPINPEVKRVTNPIDHDLMRVLTGDFFTDAASVPNKCFFGNYQFLLEKWMIYCSKLRLFQAFIALFPFVQLKQRNFYIKTVNLIDPEQRTDLCNLCNQADHIFFRMQVNGLTFADLPVDDQKILLRWKDHVFRSDHQHHQLQLQINELQLHEATFQVDFKENFTLGIDWDQDSRSFFNKAPVTCLTAVLYKGIEDNLNDKKVITILSTILNHTGAFSLKCIQRMFETPFMQDVETVHFWSDGGLHFWNKQLIWSLLNLEDPLLPGVSCEVNFTEQYHGKGELDDIDRFDQYSDFLEIDQFKKYLNFIAIDDYIYGRPLTGISDAGQAEFPMKCGTRSNKATPKRSTVRIVDD